MIAASGEGHPSARLQSWLAPGAGLIAAIVVAHVYCPVPSFNLSPSDVVVIAAEYLLLTVATGASVAALAAMAKARSFRGLGFTIGLAAIASLVAPLTTFSRRPSIWIVPVALLLAGLSGAFVRRCATQVYQLAPASLSSHLAVMVPVAI